MTAVPQLTPAGGSHGFIKILKDKDGAVLNPPRSFKIPAFVGIDDLSNKTESKMINGDKEHSIAVIGGKKKVAFAFTVDAFTGAMLNDMYYGEESQNKQHSALVDNNGYVIPPNVSREAKIRNSILLNLSRFDSSAGVKINGANATLDDDAIGLASGHYFLKNSRYLFSVSDVGKPFEITIDSNGTALVLHGKITKSLTFDTRLCATSKYTIKRGASSLTDGSAMTVVAYNANAAAPPAGSVQASYGGIIAFNAGATVGAEGKKITIAYQCDGRAVTAVIGTLPAAQYAVYISAIGGTLYIEDSGVYLINNAGAAMTGVAFDEPLAIVATGTPTSGQVRSDGRGYFLFAAADADDNVRIEFVVDYVSVRVRLPDGAVYLEDLGVRTEGGGAFTGVAESSPLAIDTDQYYSDGSGAYFFDYTNGGETVYIDCLIEKTGGNLIDIKNRTMGKSPVFQLVLHNEVDGDEITIIYPTCKCMGIGMPLKQDPSAMKFDIEIFADRATNKVGRISTSS